MTNEFIKAEEQAMWTKKEFAEIHWEGIRELIDELEDGDWDDRSKMYILIGYIKGYEESDKEL